MCGSQEGFMVVDHDSDRVLVFNKKGQLFRCFGYRGDGYGQFNLPCGICILDQHIPVVENGNKRIQVFDKSYVPVGFIPLKDIRPTKICLTKKE